MAIGICPKCRFQFSAGEELAEPQTCPACGQRFILSMPLSGGDRADAPGRQAGPLTSGAISAITLVVFFAVLVDVLIATGTTVSWFQSADQVARDDTRARVTTGTVILLVGLAGHAILSVGALGPLGRRPRRAVLLLRLALGCWLIVGGLAVATGARLWPVRLGERPLAILALAGATFLALLAYLGVLEHLADRVGPTLSWRGEPHRAVGHLAVVALILNASLIGVVGVSALWAFRHQELLGALLACLALGGLTLYAVWAAVGLARRADRPADAVRALPRAVIALLAAVVLILLARFSGLTWTRVPGPLLAGGVLLDLLAVWYCHWRLTPTRPAGVAG